MASSSTPRIVVSLPPSEPPPSAASPAAGPVEPLEIDASQALSPVPVMSEMPPAFDDTTRIGGAARGSSHGRSATASSRLAETLAFGSFESSPAPTGASDREPVAAKASVPLATSSAPPPAHPSVAAVKASVPARSGVPASSVKRPSSDHAIDEKFFSEGDLSRHQDGVHDETLTVPDTAKRKADPDVVERRERFARYVRWAVAGSAVVCVAALARTMMAPLAEPPPPPRVTAEVRPVEPSPPARVEPSSTPTPGAPSVPVVAASDPAPGASAFAAPSPSASASGPAAVSSAATPTGDPKAEKIKARTFLEQRKLALAIEAGQRSVALDPTDGEAWLLLGAALQEKGAIADARRAYASCVKEGKTGPTNECAKMLR